MLVFRQMRRFRSVVVVLGVALDCGLSFFHTTTGSAQRPTGDCDNGRLCRFRDVRVMPPNHIRDISAYRDGAVFFAPGSGQYDCRFHNRQHLLSPPLGPVLHDARARRPLFPATPPVGSRWRAHQCRRDGNRLRPRFRQSFARLFASERAGQADSTSGRVVFREWWLLGHEPGIRPERPPGLSARDFTRMHVLPQRLP